MKPRVRELREQGDRMFSKRQPLMTLWQTTAENFYVERADFTRSRILGEEFAAHLMNGRPLLARRDLGNSISSMLRPRGQSWFHPRTDNERVNEDTSSKIWLDDKGDVMRRIMYDRQSQFVRATKEGDNDFITFGQAAIQVETNRAGTGILYRNWHLRDIVWRENAELVVDRTDLSWEYEACELNKMFPGKLSTNVTAILDKDPYKKIKCRRIVLPADDYDLKQDTKSRRKLPFVSIYIDVENETILEEVPAHEIPFVIPRWVTISGSQYAYSPATVACLPDARMLQQIGLTLLEAGQKSVDPPMKATAEAIQGGVNTFAGGITWVDAEYDEKMGAALEPLINESRNLNWGDKREAMISEFIAEAFFLNKINLPPVDTGKMTAYEVQKRVEEFVRQTLPLFEPMEVEYNGAICEKTFDIALRNGAFGPLQEIPQALRGQNIRFVFDSPLQGATERAKSQQFIESSQLLKTAMELDPNARFDFNGDKAFRDALSGVARADWIVEPDQAEKAKQAAAAQQARELASQTAERMAGMAEQGGKAMQSVGEGAQALQEAAA